MKTIEQLPANISWEEIQERINFITIVHKGLRELDRDKYIGHDKVEEEFPERLTDRCLARSKGDTQLSLNSS